VINHAFLTAILHGITTQKTSTSIFTTVKTTNLAINLLLNYQPKLIS